MKTYTIAQIRLYLLSQDSLGDVLYNLDRIDEILEELEEENEDNYLPEEETDGMYSWFETQS